MSESANRERLLNDVLGEEAGPAFREALLHQTVRLARRRRHVRQVQRVGLGIAALAIVALVLWQSQPTVSRPVQPRKPYLLVRTQPLPSAAIVETRAMEQRCMVSSVPTHNIVSTTSVAASGIRELTDDELLSLAAPKSAVLVRAGPHWAELVFVNPADHESLER